MIKAIKRFLRHWHIQYPEMDIEALYETYDFLQNEIAVRRARHQSTKQQRDLLKIVTARILEEQHNERL